MITYGGMLLWEVDTGIKDGKRRSYFRKTHAEAKPVAADLKRDEKQIDRLWGDMPATQRQTVVTILQEIGKEGLDLKTVWDGYRQKVLNSKSIKRIALEPLIDEIVASKAKANRREKYINDLERRLRLFARGRERVKLDEITVEDVREFIDSSKHPGPGKHGGTDWPPCIHSRLGMDTRQPIYQRWLNEHRSIMVKSKRSPMKK